MALPNMTGLAKLKDQSLPLPSPYHRRDGTLEKDILIALKKACSTLLDWHVRVDGVGKVINTPIGMAMVPGDMKGLPDIIGLKGGVFHAIEAKAPGGRVSAIQLSTLERIRKAGGSSAIVVSVANWLKNEHVGYVGNTPVY